LKLRRILTISILLIASISLAASAKLELSGESVWRLGYGSRYFSDYGWKLDLGGFLASQEIRLDVEGEVTEGLSLEAHIDNTKGDIFQQLTVGLSWRDLWAEGGNIQYSPYIQYMGQRKSSIMGLSFGYAAESLEVRLTGGKASGGKGSRTFRGMASEEAISYVPSGPYMPTRSEEGLSSSIEGLLSAVSGADFDPELDEGGIIWEEGSASGALSDFMALHSLSELVYGPGNTRGTLVPGEFYPESSVDGLSGISYAYIILRGMPEDIARGMLMRLIRQYNEKNALAGGAALKYPYIPGSQAERDFLSALAAGWMSPSSASKATGAVHAKMALADFERGRIYPLGSGAVLPETLEVTAVTKAGGDIPLSAVAGASWAYYEGRDYLEMTLPADYTENYAYVRADYSYSLSEGIYFLGSGIVRGSVTARLDGAPLREGEDYELDYETGVLFLFTMPQTGAEGLLTVEFEYEVAGMKSWLAAASIVYKPAEDVRVSIDYAYSSVSPYLAEDQEKVPMERSYDNVMAAELAWDLSDELQLKAGAVLNASTFPGDSAKRPHAPNSIMWISDLADDSGGVWWAFLHKAGITLLSPYTGTWRQVGLPAALAGSAVLSAASDGEFWYFGTEAGIARLDPSFSSYGEGFPGVTSLWKVAGTRQGLPSGEILSLEVYGGRIYAGTPIGLVSGPADMEGKWQLYRYTEHPELGDGRVTGLASSTFFLYVATSAGTSIFDGTDFTLLDPNPARSLQKADVDAGADAIASTSDGAILLTGGAISGRLFDGKDVTSSDGHGGFAYAVTADGLHAFDFSLGLETRLIDKEGLISVATDGKAVYAAGTAEDGYLLSVYSIHYPMGTAQTIGPEIHMIPGEDGSRYLPKDPSENTVWGIGGLLALDYRGERLSAGAALKARSSGSIAGTGPGKPDSASMEIDLAWKPLGNLRLGLGDTLEFSSLWSGMANATGIRFSNSTRAGMTWNGPVSLDVSANYNIEGKGSEPGTIGHTLGMSAKLQYSLAGFRATGALSAAYKNSPSTGSYASSSAALGAYLQIGSNSSLSVSYSEPTPLGLMLSPGGSYRSLSSSFRYFAHVNTGSVTLSAKGSYRRDIRNASDSAELSVSGIYSARQLIFLGRSFLPRLEASVSYLVPQGAESRLNAYLKFSAGMSFGIFSAEMSLSNKLSYIIESRRVIDSGDGSMTAYLSVPGWTVRPYVQLGGSYSVDGGPYAEASGSWKASAKVGLSGTGKVANKAFASYSYSSLKGGRHDIGISEWITMPLMDGRMSFGAGISGSAGLLQDDIQASSYRASVSSSLEYRINQRWSVKAAAEAGLGAARLYEAPKGIFGFELGASLVF